MAVAEQRAIEAAIAYIQTGGTAPGRDRVAAALLAAEKQAKRDKVRYQYEQLLGTWRLGFITGTVKTRKQAGTALGAGRFIPGLVKIELTYEKTECDRGTVKNSVQLGAFRLQLTGPTRFWPKTNSLAFDFTQLEIRLGGLKLYAGAVRGGTEREQTFYDQTLKDQAFFSYFLASETCLAARGRGGGLALWVAA
ncbi:MAG: hypothetical protein F6J97_19770 [Leptolyngbya sp. SIO4C1]|nr:hypothetical protein [Leptolyngbya sp. SIO4C1]